VTTVAGLDTATDDVSVAVVRDSEVVAEGIVPKPAAGYPRHSETLLAELETAVSESGGWGAVDFLAAGIGPGSFTGLRVGLATARAIAQSLGKGIVPVGTLDALARGIAEGAPEPDRPLLAVLDARRGQAFAALFGPDGTRRTEPFVASPEELAERVATLPETALAAGSGALRFRRELEAAGAEVLADADSAHQVWARHLCRMAEGATPARPGAIEPIYLRPPDAQIWRARVPNGS
jgi:tRNA threonylcarbamoyladenosine biosynthesis protein TsaB